MAFLGFGKKNTEKAAKPEAPKKKAVVVSDAPRIVIAGVKDVLVRPRITEKAANMGSDSVYTFDVHASATKRDVAAAVKALYKVTPIKVNVVTIPAKRVAMRKRRGFGKTAGGKKAYVFLKKGAQIQLT